jgi:hypothetical protein
MDLSEGRGLPWRARLPDGRTLCVPPIRSANDEAILRWAQRTMTEDGIDAANSWLVVEDSAL